MLNIRELKRLVIFILLFFGVSTCVAASPERVRVSIGQPIVKSLTDAHYLLEELRDRAKGLAITNPGSLNPNEINAYQLDVLQTLVGLNVSFSQMAGVQNDFLLQDRQLFIDQQRQVLDQRSSLWKQQLDAVEQLTLAQTELAQRKLHLGNDQELIDTDTVATSLQAKVNQQTARKAVIDAQLAQIQAQLSSLGNSTPGTPSTIASAPGISSGQPSSANSKIEAATMTKMIDKVLDEAPTSHYSAQLNRYIEAEYELVAKHLSLLRSQISPDEDLVFLELPHSIIDVVPKKAKDYLIRTEWKITGGKKNRFEQTRFNEERESYYLENPDRGQDMNPQIQETEVESEDKSKYRSESELAIWKEEDTYVSEYSNSLRDRQVERTSQETPEYNHQKTHQKTNEVESNSVENIVPDSYRVLEVIPGQNALSVIDTVGKVSGLNIGAAFTWLTGIGASATMDRQRQQFRKSVAQEVFAAGYGIGESKFGWTFSPIPGAKRIDPGIKRTFAVAVVPRLTESINFEAKWCAFHRKTLPPVMMQEPSERRVICGESTTFTAEVINAHEKFWVSEVLFSSVNAGESTSVFINGDAFPEYIRVLVNNVPLRQVISMDELSNENDQPGNSTWRGLFKRSSRDSLHLVFSMGPEYTGTPLITLSTPVRNAVVNFVPRIRVNNTKYTSLASYGRGHPMFRGQLQVTNVETRIIYSKSAKPSPTHVDFIISGSGYSGQVNFYQNSAPLKPFESWRTEGMINYRVPVHELREKQIHLVARANRTQGGTHLIYDQTLDNPLYPVITTSRLLTFDEKTREGLLRIDFSGDTRSLEFVDLNNSRKVITHDAMPGRVLLSLTGQNDVISVGVKSRVFNEIVDYAVLYVPRTPSVSTISNATDQNKPQGKMEGGYDVSINGVNLNHVGTVYFGTNRAEILQRSGALLRVRVPPANKPDTIKVILETSVLLNGAPLNNLADFASASTSRFTYLEPPDSKPSTQAKSKK